MMYTKSLKGNTLEMLVRALSLKMDNELKIFLQSFKELENLFQALPLTEGQFQLLKGQLCGIEKNAKHLALYDTITHALNGRAGKWLIPADQITGMGKVDVYD